MRIRTSENIVAGDFRIVFQIRQTWENFLFIANIIEKQIEPKSVEKIDTIAYTYEKDDFKFELAYPLGDGIILTLVDEEKPNKNSQDKEKLRSIAKQVVDFFQENVPKLDKEIKINRFIKLQLREGTTYILVDNNQLIFF